MEIIILAGGFGKRLQPLTQDIPKCMVPVRGKPMLDYHLKWLSQYKISRMVLACGYKWEEIKKHYGTKFVYSVEDEPIGTAGAIKMAVDKLEGDEFFVLNADDVTNIDLNEFKKCGSNAIALARFHSNFGIVEVSDGKIISFKEKPLLPYWASTGLYLLNQKIKKILPDSGSVEKEVFPRMDLKAYKHEGFWMTVNTIKDLEDFEEAVKNGRAF